MSRALPTFFLCVAAAVTACKSDKPNTEAPPATPPATVVPTPPPAADPLTITYGDSLKVDMTKMTKQGAGVYVRDLVVGKGARADSGKTIKVHYAGYLSNGTQFETNDYEFLLGGHAVVDGWDQGIPGMKVGGKRQLVIPSAMGYPDGSGPIPAGAVIVFTVELLAVK